MVRTQRDPVKIAIPPALLALNPDLVQRGLVTAAETRVDRVSVSDVRVMFVGLRLVSEANAREKIPVRVARVRRERAMMTAALARTTLPRPPLVVELVRSGPQPLDGDDNLRVSGKHLVDAVARCAKVDDGDPTVFCYVAHQTLTARHHEVRVYIHTPVSDALAPPWHLTYNAIDTWRTQFRPALDWHAARAELAGIAGGALLTPETSRDHKYVYVHPEHPDARFLVAHDLDTGRKVLVTIHATTPPSPPKSRRGARRSARRDF